MPPSERQVDLPTQVAVLREQVAGLEKARDIQATELARRLDELNHAHAQAVLDKAQFLQRDTYEKSEAILLIWRRDVDQVLTSLQARRDSNIALFSVAISVFSLGLWAVSIFWK